MYENNTEFPQIVVADRKGGETPSFELMCPETRQDLSVSMSNRFRTQRSMI